MGDIARGDAVSRFIEEFEKDILKYYGLQDFPGMKSQAINADELTGCVYLYVTFQHKEDEVELMLPTIFFDPQESNIDLLSRLCDLLHMEADEAKTRLVEADLL